MFNKNKKRSSLSPYAKHKIIRGNYEKEREKPIATIAVFERNSEEKKEEAPLIRGASFYSERISSILVITSSYA